MTMRTAIHVEQEAKFIILASLFITFLISGALLGSKIIVFLGLTFSAGTIAFSLTFPMTDVICEVWGKSKARKVVLAGLVCMIVLFILIRVAIIAPSAAFWELQKAYAEIFNTSIRLILAGLLGYIVAEFHDIWAFMFWKKKTKGKYLWLRNNFSTAISQLLNTVIMVTIGFYGSIPHIALLPTIFGWWLIKLLVATCDTPVVYLLVRWGKNKISVPPGNPSSL